MIRRTGVRETGVSRHQGGLIDGIPELFMKNDLQTTPPSKVAKLCFSHFNRGEPLGGWGIGFRRTSLR